MCTNEESFEEALGHTVCRENWRMSLQKVPWGTFQALVHMGQA
jgi:hypothetical protein